MSDSDLIVAALAIVSVIALFAICVAVKKAWDADFYKIMWKDLDRQNDRLFDRVKELQDAMAKNGASSAVYGIGDRIVIGDRIYRVMDGGAVTGGEPVLTLEAGNDG
jgi:hypothetical protein